MSVTSDLSLAVSELLSRVEALEQAGGGDSLAPPNPVAQINPQGQIVNELPLIAEDDPNGVPGTTINWIRQSDGSTVADINGQVRSDGFNLLNLIAKTSGSLAASQVIARDPTGQAFIVAQRDGGSSGIAFGIDGGPWTGQFLARQDGASVFVQGPAGTLSRIQIEFGVQTVGFPGGSAFSNATPVNPGLTFTNFAGMIACGLAGQVGVISGLVWQVYETGGNPATFEVQAWNPFGVAVNAGNIAECYWLAFTA